MPQISFQADTQDELVEMVRRWVAGIPERAITSAAEPSTERRANEVREVWQRIRGEDSRRLVLDLAEAARDGRAVARDAALLARYGKTTGTAFAGMVGGPNKLMRRIAGRDLITWDAAAGAYRVDPRDAEVILAAARR